MDVACLVGLTPLIFWELTPGELSAMIKANNVRLKHEQEERITIAYLGAYWQRVKKMPKLSEVLSGKKEEKKKKQSPAQMLNEIKKLNAALGGTVT